MPQIIISVISKLCGIALLIISVIIAIAVLTFKDSDPTLFHANDNQVFNILGKIGANTADITLQTIGYVVFLPIIFTAIIGIQLIRQRKLLYTMFRLSILLISILSMSGLLDMLFSQPSDMPVNSIGGFIGSYIATELVFVFGYDITLYILVVCTAIGSVMSLELSIREWHHCLVLILRGFVICCIFIKKFFQYILVRLSPLLESAQYGPQEMLKEHIKSDLELPHSIIPVVSANNNQQQIVKRDDVSTTCNTINNSIGSFTLPNIALLSTPVVEHNNVKISEGELQRNARDLWQVLQDFGVNGEIVNIYQGPVVTLYELEPAAGTKSSRVIGLADDIARSMSAVSARIAVIPGKNAIGIELPNVQREIVFLKDLIESEIYLNASAQLPLLLGKNIAGDAVIADLSKMPHLLVAGTTGSGKSVAINTMIISLLFKHTPETCRLVMIDPKMLELSIYDNIPHLLTPVVTEHKKAISALKWVVKEMEDRYRAMSTLSVRNIFSYNEALKRALNSGTSLTKKIQTGFDRRSGKPIFEELTVENALLPYIVVVVDEMADLMLVAGKEIEGLIQRLAQMARAAGIHLIMATQRPSVDVITGVIKANFPTRISFQVTSKIDSRTILGDQGAEQLLGMGDMLFMMPGGKIERVHGAFISDNDVEVIVNFLKSQQEPNYIESIVVEDHEEITNSILYSNDNDDIYKKAVFMVIKEQKVSTSYIQRCFKIGYNRAALIVERMEKEGVISAPNHVGKREVLRVFSSQLGE